MRRELKPGKWETWEGCLSSLPAGAVAASGLPRDTPDAFPPAHSSEPPLQEWVPGTARSINGASQEPVCFLYSVEGRWDQVLWSPAIILAQITSHPVN